MKPISQRPVITTIIPTYRRPKMLRKAILSVLNQNFPHFQVCVYDNASGDETSKVVAEIAQEDSRVKYYCHHKNIGGIANFNFGMKKVTTPYFSLLSDDNTLLPDFFKDAINVLRGSPEAIFCSGETINIDEDGNVCKRSLENWKLGLIYPPDGLLEIIEKGLPGWDSVLFRREVLDHVGLLNPDFHGAVDQDFMMRIARNHKFYVSKRPHAMFLHHDNNWSDNRDLSEIISTRKKILEQWYLDPSLSDAMKARFLEAFNGYVKKEISTALLQKCLFGEDQATIATATNIMRKEIGFSSKIFMITTAARLANFNGLIKRLLLSSLYWYRQFKIKYRSKKYA